MLDRSDKEMPTQSMLARMTGYYPSATPRYNDAAKMGSSPIMQKKPDFLDLDGDGNKTEPMSEAAKSKKANPITRPLVGKQKNLPEQLQKAILDAPTKRMKFCGGMSKAYKK